MIPGIIGTTHLAEGFDFKAIAVMNRSPMMSNAMMFVQGFAPWNFARFYYLAVCSMFTDQIWLKRLRAVKQRLQHAPFREVVDSSHRRYVNTVPPAHDGILLSGIEYRLHRALEGCAATAAGFPRQFS